MTLDERELNYLKIDEMIDNASTNELIVKIKKNQYDDYDLSISSETETLDLKSIRKYDVSCLLETTFDDYGFLTEFY